MSVRWTIYCAIERHARLKVIRSVNLEKGEGGK